MTREAAQKTIKEIFEGESLTDGVIVAPALASELVDQVFDDFETYRSCDGCKHQPEKGNHYPMVCTACSRFYADGWRADDERIHSDRQ